MTCGLLSQRLSASSDFDFCAAFGAFAISSGQGETMGERMGERRGERMGETMGEDGERMVRGW
jgi:hypothetical protein